LLRRCDVAIDVGANEGYESLALAQAVGAAGHVFAVEPSPSNVEILRRNIALNPSLRHAVAVLPMAASTSSSGKMTHGLLDDIWLFANQAFCCHLSNCKDR
jgi:FkbM family methyltransferase